MCVLCCTVMCWIVVWWARGPRVATLTHDLVQCKARSRMYFALKLNLPTLTRHYTTVRRGPIQRRLRCRRTRQTAGRRDGVRVRAHACVLCVVLCCAGCVWHRMHFNHDNLPACQLLFGFVDCITKQNTRALCSLYACSFNRLFVHLYRVDHVRDTGAS